MTAGNADGEESRPPKSRYKVGTVIERYALGGVDEELVERWTDETDRRYSLRELADYFNQRVLRAAMEGAGMAPLDGEVENMYRLLTDDDISQGMRTQARNELERQGVDVARTEQDFVTHQAIHTYLTKYHGIRASEDEDDTADQIGKGKRTIQRLRNRLQVVTETTIERLQDTDRLALGSVNVFVDITVVCEDCDASYEVTELFDRGACECQ